MEPFEPREVKSSTGPTVSIVIILLLMLVGGAYFWHTQLVHKAASPPYIQSGESTTSTTSIQ